jgi:hypothetical protein
MADPAEQRRQAVAMSEAAAVRWAEAMRAHIKAPPDEGFSARLRGLADAARTRARATRVADAAGLRWVAHPGALRSQPPAELRPGSGRVGPEELWTRFDACVSEYNRAIAQTSARAVADAADALAEVTESLADAVDAERGQPVRGRGRGSSARSR